MNTTMEGSFDQFNQTFNEADYGDFLSDVNTSISQIYNTTQNSTRLNCPNVSMTDFSLLPSVAFLIVGVLGIYLCTLGYRFIRPSIFIMTLIVTSISVYVICCELVSSNLPSLVEAGLSLLSGLMAGLIALLLIGCLGAGLACFGAGLAMATYFLVVLRIFFHFPLSPTQLLHNSPPTEGNHSGDGLDKEVLGWDRVFPVAMTLIVLVVSACISLAVSFLKTKLALVVSTSIYGAVMVGLVTDFFTDRAASLTRLGVDCLTARVGTGGHFCFSGIPCCWTGWVIITSVPCIALGAAIFQWFCSAAGLEHKLDKMGSTIDANKRAGAPVLMEPSEKYRHLYRIRRTNGDIISRTHMEAIEVRKSNPSLMLMSARSNSDVITTTDDDATLVLTQTLNE